ncbi:MAG: hypothetical protein ACMXYE_03090 [Candidatus Woesearchaeota archaeon]
MFNKKNAQTATEYLIILAVVIIIALIVVGALGGIPGIGGGAGQAANQAFWSTAEIAIPSAEFGDMNDTLQIRNNRPNGIIITNVELASGGGSFESISNGTWIERTLNSGTAWTFRNTTDQEFIKTSMQVCPPGSSYAFDVRITYTDVVTGAQRTFPPQGGNRLEGTCAG